MIVSLCPEDMSYAWLVLDTQGLDDVCVTSLPLLTIICMDPCGKIVALPGVRTCLISRAPFSSYIYVVVLPRTATTKFAARGCRCGGSCEQGPRLSIATEIGVSPCVPCEHIRTVLTGHAVANGCWKCGSIHVGHTSWQEIVEGLLCRKIEEEIIVAEKLETVEL